MKRLSYMFIGLAVINILLIIFNSMDLLPDFWTITLPLYILSYMWLFKKVAGIVKQGDSIKSIIGQYGGVFDYIEFYNYKAGSELESFASSIRKGETSPSKLFDSIKNYLDILLLRGNQFVWFPLILIFPFDFTWGIR